MVKKLYQVVMTVEANEPEARQLSQVCIARAVKITGAEPTQWSLAEVQNTEEKDLRPIACLVR